jgi:hypothetical protein
MYAVSPGLQAAIASPERTVRLKASIDWDNDGGNTVPCSDTFDNRTSTSGWTISSDGYAYLHFGTGGTVLLADYQVSGGAGTQSVPVANGFRHAFIPASSLSIADQDIVVEWSCPDPAGAQLEPCNIEVRVQDQSNLILTRVAVAPGGAVLVSMFHNQTGNNYTLVNPAAVPNLTYSSSVHWFTRTQALGPYVRMRVWPAGRAEPKIWHAAAYDATWASGGWGLRSGIQAGNGNTKPVLFSYYSATVATSPYDDVSAKLGRLSVKRAITGQLPDDVLVVEGISAATASGDLAKGDTSDEQLDAVRYWSRFNPASPIYGKPRANRSADVAVEFLTDGGWESVPRLTNGVMRSLPVSVGDATASLELLDARDRFRTPITLPGAIADGPWDGVSHPTKPGLEASWIVSYILWQCGYPLSPPPRSTCVLWQPMHGSAIPFVQAAYAGAPLAYQVEIASATTPPVRIPFTGDAPMFLAADPVVGDPAAATGGWLYTKSPCASVAADGWDGNGRCIGIRVEAWVQVQVVSPDPFPVFIETYVDTVSTVARVQCYVGSDGRMYAIVENDTVTTQINGPTLTPGSGWHFVGWHIDDVNGRAAFRLDNTTYTYVFTPTTASPRALTQAVYTDVTAFCPIAEIHVSMGHGLAETDPWLPTTYTKPAAVDRLQNRQLTGIAPGAKPVEAWTLLQQVAGAERALVWVDYDGVPTVWSRARLNSPDALTAVRTVTAKTDLLSLSYRDDRDMIRNIVRVPYSPITAAGSTPIWSLTELASIPAGESRVYKVKFDALASSTLVVDGRANTSSAGTGTAYSFSAIFGNGVAVNVTLTSPTTADLTARNITNTTLYLVDGSGVPYLILSGQPLKTEEPPDVEVSDAASRTEFGDSPLDVTGNPWIQTEAFARGTAFQLLALLRDEQVVFDDIVIPGDPTLEPFDRIRLQDPTGLVLDTPLTLENVSDEFTNPGYESALVARPARGQWIAGGPGVGTPIGTTILGGDPTGAVTTPGGGGPATVAASAVLSASSALSAAARGTFGAAAALAAGSTLTATANGPGTVSAAATLTAASALTAGATQSTSGAAALSAASSLSAAATTSGSTSLDEWDDMTTTLLVAANDAPSDVKAAANYVCDGTADNVEIQAAITAAAGNGKRVQLSMGTFQLAAQVNLDGVDDVDVEHDIYFRGCGPSNTILVAASGLTAGIAARKVAKVHVSDMRVQVVGATHGFASVATNTSTAGYRSFWLSTWKNLQVVGPFDGTHSGYAFHFESPFRSTFENLEAVGVGNGVRLFSSNNAFNPGDCTFTRCFMDLFGNNRFGYKIESTVASGNMNQITMNVCEAIASGTGCTGIYMGGTGPVTHVKWWGVNLEQFDTIVNFNNGNGNVVDMNYVECRNVTGLSAFVFGSGSSGNMISRVGFWYCPVNINMFSKAGGSATYPNFAQDVNIFGDGGTVSLGFTGTGTVNAPGTDTLLRKRINNSGGTASGTNVNFAPGAVNF